jgi:23S rRNA U2552 (ribose-2'-O)-methylase RlmE/FtsJ
LNTRTNKKVQGFEVIAIDVDISGPIEELGCERFKLDVSSPEEIATFRTKLNNQPVDIVLNVAGKLLHLLEALTPTILQV